MNQTVYVLVKVKIDPSVDPYKTLELSPDELIDVISKIDYQFSGDGVVDTEIIDVAPLDREQHPYIAI